MPLLASSKEEFSFKHINGQSMNHLICRDHLSFKVKIIIVSECEDKMLPRVTKARS